MTVRVAVRCGCGGGGWRQPTMSRPIGAARPPAADVRATAAAGRGARRPVTRARSPLSAHVPDQNCRPTPVAGQARCAILRRAAQLECHIIGRPMRLCALLHDQDQDHYRAVETSSLHNGPRWLPLPAEYVTCCRMGCPAPERGGAGVPGWGRRRPPSAATGSALRYAQLTAALVARPSGARPTIERTSAASWRWTVEAQMAVDVA